ncbi:tetratricopeptide repeat protein [Streptomyces sp. NPDC001880]
MRKLTALTRADLDPARRHLVTTRLYSLAALTVPELKGRSRESCVPPAFPTGSRRLRAGQAEAAHMRGMATVFASAAQTHGGGHIRSALAAYLAHNVTGYLHSGSTGAAHRRLLSEAAQLTLLLGTMCGDDGADGLAQHYHQTAARLAAEADDSATYAIALRTMSAHAHELGHRTSTVRDLAERATESTRHSPSIVQAYTQAQLAVVLAHHDRRAARAALVAAERLHAQADPTPGPFTAYSIAALHYQRAQTLAALGDGKGAVRALRQALRLRTPGEYHARTLTQARLAETLLFQGHLEEALPHWQAFLDDYPSLHSTRATRRLDLMRQRLCPHQRHPAALALLTRGAELRS